MTTTRRIVSYGDVDYGVGTSAPKKAVPPASASVLLHPPSQVKQDGQSSHPVQTTSSIMHPPMPTLQGSLSPRATSPSSSTNESSMTYSKKKRLRRKRMAEARKTETQGRVDPHTKTLKSSSEVVAEMEIDGAREAKKRKRNEDNKIQRASLRQEKEQQWVADGHAVDGLDYDGLTGTAVQGEAQETSFDVSVSAADDSYHTATTVKSFPTKLGPQGWKEQPGDDGWDDETGQELEDEDFHDANGQEFDEEDEEEEDYDESLQAEWDAMANLSTSIPIPDLPLEFMEAEERPDDLHQAAEGDCRDDDASLSTVMVAIDGGRVLTEAELWDDSVLVDAWKAASEEYLLHSRQGQYTSIQRPTPPLLTVQPSPLWYDAPDPDSKAGAKARQISENNKEKRRLRAFLEDKARKAKVIEDLKRELEMEHQAQQEERLGQKGRAKDVASDDNNKTVLAQPVDSAPSDPAAPRLHPIGLRSSTGRAIPPSIGLSGNAAWQAACATVASTRNRIGGETLVAALPSGKSLNGTAQVIPNGIGGSTSKNDYAMSIDVANGSPSQASMNGATNARSTTIGPSISPVPPSTNSIPAPSTLPPPPPTLSQADIDHLTTGADAIGHSSTSNGGNSGEILQRICSSWYYAGYWTAQWEESRRRGGVGS